MFLKSALLVSLVPAALGVPYVNPYFGKYFHGQRTSADSSSQGNIYPVQDCSTFINDNPEGSWSGQNTSAIPEGYACCYEWMGTILLTQFWNYNTTLLEIAVNGTTQEVVEAELRSSVESVHDDLKRTFTIHGTWNDMNNGSYTQYCDPDLEISDEKDNITHVLVDEFNEVELYEIMSKYWIDSIASNVDNLASVALWEHEYNKHGTCMDTLNPSCFTGNYTRFENTVNFWKKTVEIWSQLDTYQFLAQADIYPTVARKYKLSDVQAALQRAHGAEVYVACLNNSISEIWYYHLLQGSLLTGNYRAIDSLTNSSCKEEEVWYIPK
ncbi:Ribonuclease T2-like 1-A [Candida viswanathii]|uniref:ribonuclease T2 n=1 Tax=Candida viswanathii TaxID=5486 RepID=A0A367Y0Q6_9ASCO|nr:Ribonuclease T2-like 1-A [Candida viswanathii]